MVLKRINKDSDKIRVGKNFASLTLLQVANVLLPLVTLPYLVRVLGAEKFGLVIFAQSFAVFFGLLVEFGFNLSATREIAVNRESKMKISAIFSSVMLIKGALLILAFLLLVSLVLLIPRLQQDREVFLLSFGVVFGQALFPHWFYQGVERMTVITIVNVSAKLIFTLLILTLIKKEADYLLVPLFHSLGYIVAGIMGLLWALRSVRLVIPQFKLVKRHFLESFELFVSNFSTSLYTYSNVIILGALTNNATVGIYASMEKLILAIKSLYTPFLQAFFPYTASKSKQQTLKHIDALIRPFALIGILASFVLCLFPDQILNLIFNDPAINAYSDVLRILGGIAFFSALSMLFNYLFLTALKKYRERMKIMIYAGIFNVVVGIFLVQLYGIYGMAFTALLTELLLLLMGASYFYKVKHEKIDDPANRGS